MVDQPSGQKPGKSQLRPAAKSQAAFRTISEASEELDVPQHVLRFWETKFSQIRPLKRGGRRRYYRPEDIALLTSIRDLLYDKGYTIKGVQRLLKEGAVNRRTSADDAEAADRAEVGTVPSTQETHAGASAPLNKPAPRYSPFSRDDILAAQDSPDAIAFNPSRSQLQTAISELKSLRADLAKVAAIQRG